MRKKALEPKLEGDLSACFCPIIHLAVHIKDKHLKKGLGTLAEQKFSTDC